MDTVIGIATVVFVVWLLSRLSAAHRRSRPMQPKHVDSLRRRDEQPPHLGPIPGWLLGHQIARGHHGFPGDPLPGGHLGSPENLAFWGGLTDTESEDGSDPDDEL